MTGFHEQDGVLYADNIPLSALAEDVGTPSYIYCASEIKKQYDALSDAMKRALPADRQPMYCYASKANSNIAILAYLRSLGSSLEVVSEGEIRRGLKAGFEGKDIVFTGVGKSEQEIEFALKTGIYQFNVESIPELERIGALSQKLDIQTHVVFRLNPDIAGAAAHAKTSTGGKRDKFGISSDRVIDAFAIAYEMSHVSAAGLSVHIGSQINKVEKFEEAFAKLPELVGKLRELGHEITRLDIGGGFPIVYNDEDLLDLDQYARWVADIIVPLDTEIMLEPGRYYVGNCGVLLTRAEYIKETQDHTFLVLDAAMNDLIRPTLYNAYHGVEPVEYRARPVKSYDIVGPICESGDTFAKGRELPEMKQGELAVIRSTGAYGFCMASNYNSRVLPPEILVHDKDYTIIRPRQSFEDIMGVETIPDWLKD